MIYKCITVHYDFYWNYTALVELHFNIVNYLLGWFCYCQPYFNYLHHKNWTFTKYVKWAFDYWAWISNIICCDLFRVQWVKMRGDCSFCCYWWNWWRSLFKLSFHITCYNIEWNNLQNRSREHSVYLFFRLKKNNKKDWFSPNIIV
jgi:hypothetical protein